MRLSGLLALGLATIAPFEASAEPLAVRIVELMKRVCVDPRTPEAMIQAAQHLAAVEAWTLIGAAATPIPIMHNSSGPKLSFTSTWDIGSSEGSATRLSVSILRHEIEGVRYSVCTIQPSQGGNAEEFATAIEGRFGTALTADRSSHFVDSRVWFFTDQMARGNCGKQITILEHHLSEKGKPATAIFMDVGYPNDGSPAYAATRCRR
jgi:hypothetical protein